MYTTNKEGTIGVGNSVNGTSGKLFGSHWLSEKCD